MPADRITERNTAKDAVDHWVTQLHQLFDAVARNSKSAGWVATTSSTDIREDPFGLGAPLEYDAPVLILKRLDRRTGEEQRITFEPRQRYMLGAAGRIDVYSYPGLREAMLLRIPDATGAADLTWEETENRVARAPWKAFSPERLPLAADISRRASLAAFLNDLVE